MKKKKKIINIISLIIPIFILIIITIYLITMNTGGSLQELKSNEVIKKINNKETFVLCVSQTTCSHCMMYKPTLKKLANKHNINIYYVDIDLFEEKEEKEFEKYIHIDGTPTTIFYINGEEKTTAYRLEGNVPSYKVEEKLKKLKFID